MYSLRPATLADLSVVVARTRALNAVEHIEIADDGLAAAAARLLADPTLGHVWLVEHEGRVIGHAVVTYGFDLEFGGRDAFLTELWVDPEARGRGAATLALQLLGDLLGRHDIRALHLGVLPDNPARRLYERSGFVASPRIVMTRVLRPRP
jgi:GNAT superfamily N-acetyltransferase